MKTKIKGLQQIRKLQNLIEANKFKKFFDGEDLDT